MEAERAESRKEDKEQNDSQKNQMLKMINKHFWYQDKRPSTNKCGQSHLFGKQRQINRITAVSDGGGGGGF